MSDVDAKTVLRAGKQLKYFFSMLDEVHALMSLVAELHEPANLVKTLQLQAEEQTLRHAEREAAMKQREAESEAAVSAAKIKAEDILASARTVATEAQKKQEDATAFDAATRAKAQQTLDAARTKLNGIQAEIVTAESRLAELKSEIAAVKAKFA